MGIIKIEYAFKILNNLHLKKTTIIKKDQAIPKVDYCIGLLSLPYILKTDINSFLPKDLPNKASQEEREK